MLNKPYRLYQAAVFKLRGLLLVPPIAFLFFWTRWEWEPVLWIWILGLSLFGPGVALRIWSQRYLRYRLREGKGLAIFGPYAWMRNPVYIGNLLMFAGLCVMCELPWAIPFVLGWGGLVYHTAVRFEEDRLTKRYGDAYTTYCASVPRWLPRVPKQASPVGSIVSLWRAAAVEWQCLLLAIVPLAKECWY